MNIAEPIIRIEKRLESLLNDFKGLKEDLNKVNQSLDNLKTATEHKKKYRPFTLDEWKEVIKDNYQWITMRVKGTNQEFSLMYTGFVTTTKSSYISLGSHEFDFKNLADNYEIFVNNQWQPFGVEVEE